MAGDLNLLQDIRLEARGGSIMEVKFLSERYGNVKRMKWEVNFDILIRLKDKGRSEVIVQNRLRRYEVYEHSCSGPQVGRERMWPITERGCYGLFGWVCASRES